MKTKRGLLFMVLCATMSVKLIAQNQVFTGNASQLSAGPVENSFFSRQASELAATPVPATGINNTNSVCNGTRKNIQPWPDGGIYFSGKPTGFNYLPHQPGDTLVLRASLNKWNYFSLDDVHGSEACPIVIINEGGVVELVRGITLTHCSNIKLTGSGSSDFYGIKVHNPADDDQNGVAVAIMGRSRSIEVERIDVHKKTYGAWIKQDPGCVDSINYPSWHMDNIKFHDSRFKNIGQDCIYAGNTDPIGSRPVYCNGVETHPIPMRLSNISIYNLIIDSCNRTGIQLGGADSGYNAIYNNIVTRCGYELNQQQGTGISIGGMTTNCHVYGNKIRQTFLYGILALGIGTNYVENNDIDSSGYLGNIVNTISQPGSIYVDTRPTIPFDSSRFVIRNNRLGKNASQGNHDIFFEKTIESYAAWNLICNNTRRDGITPATFYLRQGIHWNDCGPEPVGNRPPVVNAGADATIMLPVNSATLPGSAMDPDGYLVSYAWTKISGPAAHLVSPPNQPHTVVLQLTEGVYAFELAATDNGGATARDTIKITVLAAGAVVPNLPPVALAGPDRVITLPVSSITMNGAGTDADGAIMAFEWKVIGGPSQYACSNPLVHDAVFHSLVQGTYLFELKVTDNEGATARDTMTLSVVSPAPPSNARPTAAAGADQVITLPQSTVTLSGSGNDTDGTITTYAWTALSGPAGCNIVSPASAQTVVSGLVAGSYVFELAVTDNGGATAKDSVTIQVLPAVAPPANLPPVVHAGNALAITGSSTQLQGTAHDPDGTIAAVSWTMVNGPANYAIAAPGQLQTAVSNLVQGVYDFELAVTDNAGATAKDTVTITVHAIPNTPPVAHAGAGQSITLPQSSVTLAGYGTDADGTITAYEWTLISGPAAHTIQTPAAATTLVSGMVQGVYRFRLQVWDDRGAVAADTVEVTVHPAPPVAPPLNTPPTAYAGPDISITLPVNFVILNGSGTDVEGAVSSYRWTRISGPASHSFSNPDGASTLVLQLAEGLYGFELEVLDGAGASGRDTVWITVAPALPVTVHAGPDVYLALPQNSVSLQASVTNHNGSGLRYEWTRVSGPSSYTLLATGPAALVSDLGAGSYAFALAVHEGAVEIGRDTVMVHVAAGRVQESKVTVYPNPAVSEVTLRIESITHRNVTSIRIFNAGGVLVYTESFLRNEPVSVRTIDVSRWAPGMYFVEAGVEINKTVGVKFFKQ